MEFGGAEAEYLVSAELEVAVAAHAVCVLDSVWLSVGAGEVVGSVDFEDDSLAMGQHEQEVHAESLGQPAAAQPMLERALAIDEAAYGPGHSAVAHDLNNLAAILRDLGQPTGRSTAARRTGYHAMRAQTSLAISTWRFSRPVT